MNYWYEALEGLSDVQQTVSSDSLTVDQKLKIVEIKALLAIGQDLNALRLKDHEPFN
ncbi:hypothetical protein PY310_05325 [Pseudarthrobacter sp. H3Y2-7]|uniref:hypothetical protein n=1 Tax=Pseudarthrobacter naphthalenicus TaxID=3031328 RepID=UPI0023B1B615|nr:hypothetical protein [Pseudarthrobacter sp. H3Y2-7]MDE8668004.1 hypothetical protein [Pseudarthrobacter sp. H3Y2-7]